MNSLPPSPQNLSQEETSHKHPNSEVGNVSLLDHHIEGEVETLEEGCLSLSNLHLTNPIGPPIVELPSARSFNPFTRYKLPPCLLPWHMDPISTSPMITVILDFQYYVSFPNISLVRGTSLS